MTIQEVKDLMGTSTTAQEWNANCDKVKKACNGYPDFWFKEIIVSGFADSVLNKFGEDSKIRIRSIEKTVPFPTEI